MFGDPGLKNASRGQFPERLQKLLYENCAVADPVRFSYYRPVAY